MISWKPDAGGLLPEVKEGCNNIIGPNPGWLKFVRTHPCLICRRLDVIAHHPTHLMERSRSTKASDYLAVPLCPKHHHELHDWQVGAERGFWTFHGIDPTVYINRMWKELDMKRALESPPYGPGTNSPYGRQE